jgi:hypothetical protein
VSFPLRKRASGTFKKSDGQMDSSALDVAMIERSSSRQGAFPTVKRVEQRLVSRREQFFTEPARRWLSGIAHLPSGHGQSRRADL